MKRAPLISRDFEEILSAPLEIQIFKIINIKRPPNLVPGGALKGGASNILWTVLFCSISIPTLVTSPVAEII